MLMSEERNGFLPGGNIAIDARRFFPVLTFVFDAEFGLASQILVFLQVLVQVVVRRFGMRSGRRASRSTRAPLFARATVGGATVTGTSIGWASVPGATTSTASAPSAGSLGIFRAAFVGGFIRFFKSPLVQSGSFGRIFEFVIGGTLLVAEIRLAVFTRSFVAHRALPIHRSSRSSSRT
jgi:hypothetical protein